MTTPERATFARLLAGLAITLGHTLTREQIAGYLEALDDLPLEALSVAVRHARRAAKFFPRPAELREWAGDRGLDAAAADALVRGYLWGRALPEGSAPFVALLVERLGGRRALEDMPEGVRYRRVVDALAGVTAAAAARQVPIPTERQLAAPIRPQLEGPR